MVDASLGTIQCLEEIVSTCLACVRIVFVISDVRYIKMVVIAVNVFAGLKSILLPLPTCFIAFLFQISEFVQKDEIKPAVIQLLWERFTEKSQCSSLDRRAAVMLLGMMAR